MGLKLVFVAATMLALAALALPLGARTPAEEAYARGSDSRAAPRKAPFTLIERRASVADGVQGQPRVSPGPVIGLICAIAASSLALGVAFGLRRRIDRIAGPDPEREDDG
jgi:hypothetical protein